MANNDWIKMRGSLTTHPKVLSIAHSLSVDEQACFFLSADPDSKMLVSLVKDSVCVDVVLASLMRVWLAFNEHSDMGVMRDVPKDIVDTISGVPGFAELMENVGWLKYDEEARAVNLPNFEEYNAPSKTRKSSALSNAERQKRYRENKRNGITKRNVTRNVTRCNAGVTDRNASVTNSVTNEGDYRGSKSKSKSESNKKKTSSSKKTQNADALLANGISQFDDAPTLEWVVSAGANQSPPRGEEFCKDFWLHYEAAGWHDGANRDIRKSWRAKLAKWKGKGVVESLSDPQPIKDIPVDVWGETWDEYNPDQPRPASWSEIPRYDQQAIRYALKRQGVEL